MTAEEEEAVSVAPRIESPPVKVVCCMFACLWCACDVAQGRLP